MGQPSQANAKKLLGTLVALSLLELKLLSSWGF